MQRVLSRISFFLLLCGLATQARAEQILSNPDFEQLDGVTFKGWRPDGVVAVAETGRSGRCAKLGKQGRVLQCFPLQQGFVYRGTVWARGRGELYVAFYVYRDGPGMNYAGGEHTEPIQVTTDWQRYELHYAPAPAEKEFKGMCFAVAAGKDDETTILIDDVALEREPLAKVSPNLLLNHGFADGDGDGIPDHWKGEHRRLRVESGPTEEGVLRIAATLFSEDYLPPPDFSDWWSWNRWGEQHGSGWPALPRPLGGAYAVLVESDPVPVRPGQRYDVTMLLRHLKVWGEFVAVRWFNGEKKPLAEFEERIAYNYISYGDTSGWKRYLGRVTSPQGARFASVALGCKLSSGMIWLAQPKLSEGLGLPNRHEPRSEWLPVESPWDKFSPPAVMVPETVHHSPPTRRGIPARQKAGVSVSEDEVAIALGNGVHLTMPLINGRVIGITSVVCGNMPLRNAQAPPVAPVIQTAPARHYVECVYVHPSVNTEEIVIHTTLRTASGESDSLDWVFAPISRKLARREYRGLRYGYRFRSSTVNVWRIMDRATWEVGGTPLGLQVGSELQPLDDTSTYCLACAYRFVEAESFDYQTGKAGTMVSFFDRYHTSLFCRAATRDFLILQDTFLFPEVREAATTMKNILFCDQPGNPDDWAAVREELYARHRAQLNAPPERPLEPAAMFIGYGGLRGIGDLRPEDPKIGNAEYYRWVADNAVPRLAALGFKRLMMVLPRGPWNWSAHDINHLCPETVEPFKYLCDVARRHGMSVISWYGTAQNLDGAPVWTEHPEFILRTASGERSCTYYSPWGWPGKLEAGFAEYTLAGLREARERTGLAGLWLDSYSSATHLLDTAIFAEAVHQADGLLPWHAAIERMGYYTYCEGAPHGLGVISTGGWNPPEHWDNFRPEVLYKQGLYLQQPWTKSSWPHEISDIGRFLADREKFAYYRMLANFCCPILDLGHFGTDEEAMQRIARANHDFNAVSDLMQKRHLLGNKGVEWISPKGRAVFAFAEMTYHLPAGIKRVEDVTVGKTLPVSRMGILKMEKYHTYKLLKMR